VFCPNCGTKNDDTAMPCTKCGFKLSGASAPKFRGTMMLNSEQSVQEMVEEHRSKLAEGGSDQDPAKRPPAPQTSSGDSATGAAAATPAPAKSVLQPPRAGLAKRRMGTMLGVAPQMGGVQPPDAPGDTPPPPPSLGSETKRAGLATDPLGGTVAFAAVPPPAAQMSGSPVANPSAGPATGAGRSAGFAVVPPGPSPAISPLAAGRTEAFQQVSAPMPNPLAAGRTEAFTAVPPAGAAPARGRTEAFEAAPPSPSTAVEPVAGAHARSEPPESYHPAGVPRTHLRPLDVFLVVITCGLYGVVLWAQQRRKPG
jgi:hypothetical protein